MPKFPDNKSRCAWCTTDPIYIEYHDTQWGLPVHDDTTLFEMLILEGAQAGLSWLTVLKRRDSHRRAYEEWDAERIACFDDTDRRRLLADSGIIRNRRKIDASITNAQAFLRIREEFGTFDRYIWRFTDYQTLVPQTRAKTLAELPTTTPIAQAMSKDLRLRGFQFVGPTICYAYMQAVGMVDDHMAECFISSEA